MFGAGFARFFCLNQRCNIEVYSNWQRKTWDSTGNFKYEGELYNLATDQGYINQPDLVWEKMNEVIKQHQIIKRCSNFKVFKVDDNSNRTWDEQNAMSTTADYLASIDSTLQEHSSFKFCDMLSSNYMVL